MKIQFDSSQDYQLQAIKSITDIFEGQPLSKGDNEISFAMEGASIAYTENGIGNNLLLTDEQLLKNIQLVQERNGIAVSDSLAPCVFVKDGQQQPYDGTADYGGTQYYDGKSRENIPYNFTVEMETGTGKTYTYLRTIYELNKIYGFKKFVIVVPSVAIREGTVKNLEITHEHFQTIYNNTPANFKMYDSKSTADLRNFAISNAVEILVINIDSFTKDNNIINTVKETGVKPIDYIQATLPIVIVDEPQNMETDVRKAGISNLKPLCTLRYSATHKNHYNLVYNLNPVQAYDLGLVKQIEVDGITADSNYNAAFIQFRGIVPGKKELKVKLTIYANEKGGVKQKDVICAPGDDLFKKSEGREIYKEGFIINNINAVDNEVEFSNGQMIREGEAQGGLTDEVMKYQVRRTVQAHLDKMRRFKAKGIKVLSLFFVDKVANYRDANGEQGKFAIWFEEIFNELTATAKYAGLVPFTAGQVHNGYFSQDKKGISKDSKEGKSNKDDEDTFTLIMKEKERLLSFEEPLQFIFSHSALREGWDNPNVFQICTLNESKSEIKKRQEIGRGLRLPVDKSGKRIQDKNINVLTIVANETYEDFTNALQSEIEEETSVSFEGKIKDARKKGTVRRNKELTIENFPLLFDIWERISQKTKYNVQYDTQELIKRTVAEMQDSNKVPATNRPMLEARKAKLSFVETGIEATVNETGREYIKAINYPMPDVYGYIQSRIDVTRTTIYEILKQSGRYEELTINPQMFLDNVIAAIQRTLNTLMIDGIKYERINGAVYEMSLFDSEEMETYLSNLVPVSNEDKTVFNYYRVDSDVESLFAKDCETDEKVKFFFKLPRAFKIPTPIGNYNPDWAVVFDGDKRIYFVAETKGTTDWQQLKATEEMKIKCGKAHFSLFKDADVEYRLATQAKDLYGK